MPEPAIPEDDRRPAVVNGDLVWLPTLPGLLRSGGQELPPVERAELWDCLAAAVNAQANFDAVGFTAERPIDLRSDGSPAE
ncbi:MAG: hypothetical protein HKN03_16435 [Acidimicrobiales bacterium]|nr:hypothetical protein [Acidimicrobiales bacterium]